MMIMILSGGDGIDTASFELLTGGIRADLAFGEIYTNEDADSIYEIVNFVIVEFDEVKTYTEPIEDSADSLAGEDLELLEVVDAFESE